MPGTKTAGWLVGHLAFSGDYGRRLCGRQALCDAGWAQRFGPGTQPSTDASSYPAMALLGRLDASTAGFAFGVAAGFAVLSRLAWVRSIGAYTSASS